MKKVEMTEILRFKSFNKWFKQNQQHLIDILAETKNRRQLIQEDKKRRINVARSIDDMPDKALIEQNKQKYKLQSEHLKKLKSNANLSSKFKKMQLRNKAKMKPILDEIKIGDIQKPKNLDIRNLEYKHILRRHFDLLHWEVLLRIVQVNNRADQEKNFNLMKNQMDLDYKMKYNTIFKKSDYKSGRD